MLIKSPRGGNGLRVGLMCLAAGCLIAFWAASVIVAGSGNNKRGRAVVSFAAGSPSVLAGYDRAFGLLEAKRDGEARALLPNCANARWSRGRRTRPTTSPRPRS